MEYDEWITRENAEGIEEVGAHSLGRGGVPAYHALETEGGRGVRARGEKVKRGRVYVRACVGERERECVCARKRGGER